MRIYNSPKENYRWIFQPFRDKHTGAGREEKIRNSAKKNDFRYISVFASGDALHAAYTSEKNGYDFAARFASYCSQAGLMDVVYVERNNDDHNAIVIIKGGLIKQDKIGSKEDIEDIVNSFIERGDIADVRLVNFQFLENGFMDRVQEAFSGRVENLSAALTDKLEPTDEFEFLPEREAISKIQSRRPWFLYAALIVFVFFAVSKLISYDSEEVKKQVVVDPYSEFYQAMNNDVVQVLNRAAQDYNTHVGLLTLPGWSVDKVTHTKGQVSYRMMATESGELDTLKRYAAKSGLHVMINANEIVLLGHGANVPVYKGEEAKLYNVEAVHHFIRDAVNEYIPGAKVEFLRDVPKGAEKKWVIRELMFQFRGIYKEDLMTLGSLTKNLPVSLGGDSSDPNAGQYIVDKERFTGGIKISVFGDKQ